MTEFVFPPGFLWGAATSAHQVEGNNVHSDWWTWEQTGHGKDRSGLACDHYHRYAADFDLAASLGHNAHRFSIEWARLEPQEGQWDDAALQHYVDVVQALRRRHIEPIVTLHHFTTPQWLAAQGGWENAKVIEAFARYVRRVAQALKGQVRYWITINEPIIYVRLHYLIGTGPPGAKDVKRAISVAQQMIRAHAAAYHALHEVQADAMVSIAHHVAVFQAHYKWSPFDQWMTWLTHQAFNAGYLRTFRTGVWRIPTIAAWRFPEAVNTLDYLGINYYSRQFIRFLPLPGLWPGDVCDLAHHEGKQVKERTSFGWDVYPEGFEHLLAEWGRQYPVLVTENGAWMAEDARRWAFIERHLQAMARAMQGGANVLGYCYWSLLDNFEWADGFGPRFGIVEVDYATQQRRPRDSARRYAEVCRTNRLSLDG